MSEIGSIGWLDLTVDDADGVRDFYARVVGWESEPLDMGGYSDYVMKSPESGTPRGGVCHARGPNAGLPAQWLAYLIVADLDVSLAQVEELGGQVVSAPRSTGDGSFAVIRDPAGAVVALYAKEG